MVSRRQLSAITAATLALMPGIGSADNARDWQNTPTDLNMVFGYYNRLDTNTPIDTSLPITGLSLNADLYLFRYARSFGIDGRNSAIQFIQPYADISASFDNAQFFSGTKHNGGMGDTQVVFAHNFFGGPALTAAEFANWTPETFLTGAVWLTMPTGDYDKDRIINIGSNRWVFKPEIGFGTPIGPTWLEINTYVSLFGDNKDYHGDSKLEQKPLYAIEGHYSYTINRALWVSLDATYNRGGESRIDGDWQDNKQENGLLGTSLGFMLTPQFGGLLAYSDTVSERTGSPDVNTWTFRLQYVW
ncbi:transporter [Pseudomonas marginalis]|uniref:Transporter n=1 Tax=Pseudomonas marginalis TaxID=298 RepID=A0A9X9FWM8_PSEMA|nr:MULTISPECIES: transporter [Pseudomonas]TWR56753.1 transporter [Pseudomonas marginalis]SAM30939.1 Protein involved in meta-pathway of phenol degradation [Pseudomonas sp. 1 R 17]SEC42945.1 Putative MetA-pathway of phenol degradation [Pseudomonas marginalis]